MWKTLETGKLYGQAEGQVSRCDFFDSWDVSLLPCGNLACVLSCFSQVWHLVTPRTVACQAPLFTGFSRQEYWSGLLWSPPGDLPDPWIEPKSLESPALASEFFTTSTTYGNLTCIKRQHLLGRSRTSRVKDVEPPVNNLNPDLPLDVFSHPISALCFSHLCLGFCQLQQKLFFVIYMKWKE